MVTLPPEDNALGNWQNFFRAYIKEPFVSVSVVDAGPCENTHCNFRKHLLISATLVCFIQNRKNPKPLKHHRESHLSPKHSLAPKLQK